ncbi:MAG: DUF2461 domain-containing protein [Acidobacteriota bacterium]
MTFRAFPKDLLRFLKELEKNNDKAWFDENRKRYEEVYVEPALDLAAALSGPLQKMSPHLQAIPKKVGGSLMRIHRDVRFSKDKTPYNVWLSMRFLHDEGGKGAPGFYLRIDPKHLHLGVGIWHPDKPELDKIREHLQADPKAWVRLRDGKALRKAFPDMEGESLKRPPKGIDPDHPIIEDLKRKDFCFFGRRPSSVVTKDDFFKTLSADYRSAAKFLEHLCRGLDLSW